jgi:hypothetical protein|eukprot:1148558-Prymnesium_polylepis.1
MPAPVVQQFVGIAAVSGIVKDALCGNSPWVDSSLIPRLVRLSGMVALDRCTSSASRMAEKYATGADSLKGKVIVITGSTGGLGQEAARVLIHHGAHVVFAVRTVSKGEAVLKSIMDEGATGKGTVLELDVRRSGSHKGRLEPSAASRRARFRRADVG